jgi:hypothetical protein
VARVRLLEQQGEIKAGGAAADAEDAHAKGSERGLTTAPAR